MADCGIFPGRQLRCRVNQQLQDPYKSNAKQYYDDYARDQMRSGHDHWFDWTVFDERVGYLFALGQVKRRDKHGPDALTVLRQLVYDDH